MPARLVGILAGFGAGALIAAISFDLVGEAEDVLDRWQFALWMLVGVAVFLLADKAVESRFGEAGVGGAMGIVVGSVVDGVPESAIFGIQVGTGVPDQPELPGRCLHLQHPAEHRAVRRPLCRGLVGETRRNTLVLGRARLRRRRGSRLPGHRPDVRCTRAAEWQPSPPAASWPC